MPADHFDAYVAACPTRQALDRIADKWTVLIVGLLEQRPHRFGELLKGIEGISQKMLTQTLRSLEFDGLVSRRVKPTVPVTVEYSLTSTGRTLAEPVDAIRRWAEQHIESVLAARARGRKKRASPHLRK
jgi:DNA-binding HxlR family transcriptional regulator